MNEAANYQNSNRYPGGAILGANRDNPKTESMAMVGEACCAEQTVRVSGEVRAVRNFADALMSAMDGKRATRAGWNAAGQYVAMQIPDKGSKMSQPYLYLKNAQNEMVPWVPSQSDLFASDWAILPN